MKEFVRFLNLVIADAAYRTLDKMCYDVIGCEPTPEHTAEGFRLSRVICKHENLYRYGI